MTGPVAGEFRTELEGCPSIWNLLDPGVNDLTMKVEGCWSRPKTYLINHIYFPHFYHGHYYHQLGNLNQETRLQD